MTDATFTLIEGARTVAMPEAQGLELVARAEANTRTTLDRLLKALGFTDVRVDFADRAAGG